MLREKKRLRAKMFDHFVCAVIRLSFGLFIRPFARSFDRRSVGRSVGGSLTRSFALFFDRSLARSLVRSSARSLVRSFARSLVRSFARSLHRLLSYLKRASFQWSSYYSTDFVQKSLKVKQSSSLFKGKDL